jgi:CPA2 family monovalent cation:H+ antiporter-2
MAWIGVLLLLVAVLKAGSALGLARILRMPGVSPWQLSTGLAQVGEFSFVLSSVAVANGFIEPDIYTAILCTVVLTISLSTILVRWRGPAWTREPTAAGP